MSKQKFITVPKEDVDVMGPLNGKYAIQLTYSSNDFLRNASSYLKFCSHLVRYPWVEASINCNEMNSKNFIAYSFSGRTREEIRNLKHELIDNVNNQEKFVELGNLEKCTKFESPNSVECNRCCECINIIFIYNSEHVFQLYCEYFEHLLQMFSKYKIYDCEAICTKTKQIFQFRLQMDRPNIRILAENYMGKQHNKLIGYLKECGFENVIKTQQ